MKYLRVKWTHSNPDEPVWIFTELDSDEVEVRKIECFANGFCDYATPTTSTGTTALDTGPLPLEKLAQDPQLDPVEITEEEFEKVWASRQYHP